MTAKKFLKESNLVPSYEKDSIIWMVDFNNLCKVLEAYKSDVGIPTEEEVKKRVERYSSIILRQVVANEYKYLKSKIK